jgi:hypothetical protein
MAQRWRWGVLAASIALGILLPMAAARDAGSVSTWDPVVSAVRKGLAHDPKLADDRIKVSASGMVLTVSGTVDSDAEKDRANSIAKAAADPEHMFVVDDLRVAARPDGGPGDAALALEQKLGAEVGEQLGRLVPSSITVTVRGQTATLAGVVPSEDVRMRALHVARAAVGVDEVLDHLEVRATDAGVDGSQ